MIENKVITVKMDNGEVRYRVIKKGVSKGFDTYEEADKFLNSKWSGLSKKKKSKKKVLKQKSSTLDIIKEKKNWY